MNSTFRIVGWSIYLCCSWMWCIGLLYPVLLYRDFGIHTWFLFTIPNILGAVSVPWLIKNAKMSDNFIRQHSFACQAFSFATIVFQFYFMLWITISFKPALSTILITIFLCFLLFFIYRKRILTVAAILFIISLIALFFISKFSLEMPILTIESNSRIKESMGLLPVFLIGFFFCPYLDLTFHRVIQEFHDSQAKLVYVIAFPCLFLGLLLLGIQYYPIVTHILDGSNFSLDARVQALYYYMILQAAFTLFIHIREWSKQNPPSFVWILLVGVLVFVLLYGIFGNAEISLLGNSMHLREILYRGLLSVYGLLAPIYIWTFAVIQPRKSQRYAINHQKWIIWLLTVLLVMPMYVIGFYGDIAMIPYVLPAGVLLALTIPFVALRLTSPIKNTPNTNLWEGPPETG